MQNKGKAVFYVIAGGYLMYLAYQLFGSRMDDGGKNYMLSLIFSILFVVAGAGIWIYTAIMYRKMLKAEAEEGKESEGGENSAEEEDTLKDK